MTKSPSSSPKLSSPFRRKEKAWFLYFNIRPLILSLGTPRSLRN
ncbi:hypothetical protein V6Z11_D04G124900 [Gossypium hirsutum]